jgi:phage terminase small subunit
MEGTEDRQPWKRLKPQQMRFVDEYMRDSNATRAAAAAGYGATHADVAGTRLINNPDVLDEIERRRAVAAGYATRSQADLVRRLETIAFSDFGRFIRVNDDGLAALDLTDATPDELAIIAECSAEEVSQGRGLDAINIVKTKIKLLDPLRAAEMLAKLHGWNAPEKHEHSGPGGASIPIEDLGRVSPADAMRAYLALTGGKV